MMDSGARIESRIYGLSSQAMSHAERVDQFKALYDSDHVNLKELSDLCIQGVPDVRGTSSIRPFCWRLLLGYEPLRRSDRATTLRKKRREYYQFVNDLLVDPFIEASREPKTAKIDRRMKKGKRVLIPSKTRSNSNPLNEDPKYTSYYADNLTLEQIDKDVRRTLSHIAFFQQPTHTSHLSPLSPHLHPKFSMELSRPSIDMQLGSSMMTTAINIEADEDAENEQEPEIKTRRTIFARLRHLNRDYGDHSGRRSMEAGRVMANRTSLDEEDVEDLHWESIERILFIYAKLNPGISYVQGMNELLAPLYFVLANDEDEEHRAHSEADCFYCFTAMMSDCRDLFERTHDHTTADDAGRGINAVMTRFMDRLKQLDPDLHKNIVEKSIEPTYFAFRWFCCRLAQEFDLPDVIRIWDSILADRGYTEEGSPGFLTDFCCALLINVRSQLMQESFADNIKMLQAYPPQDLGPILSLALTFRDRKSRQNMKDQVTQLFSDFRLPQFSNPERETSRTVPGIQTSPARPTTFSSLRVFQNFLHPTNEQVTSSVETDTAEGTNSDMRQSVDIIRPTPVRIQAIGQQIYHAPPENEKGDTTSRLSYELPRPQLPSLPFSSPKKWFSAVPEDSEGDFAMSADADTKFGFLKSKSASFFKKAGAFVSNTHPATHSEDELRR